MGKLSFKTPEDTGLVGREAAKEELPEVRQVAQAWLGDIEASPFLAPRSLLHVAGRVSDALPPASTLRHIKSIAHPGQVFLIGGDDFAG